MSQGVAFCCTTDDGVADVSDWLNGRCERAMSHLDGFCLATFSDTFATQCDTISLNFTGAVPTADER
jgi:hypothetical protein